jgi:flagella synthesis protein FlgN
MTSLGTNPAEVFDEERAAIHLLLEVLRREQTRLIDADVEGLAKLTEEKSRAAAAMSELAKRRHRMLAAAGFEATESGMQSWVESPAAGAADRESWKALLELAHSAKELNRVNGLLISQHIGRNQSALNVLHGAHGGNSFYGPNGQSTTKIGSRRLVVG